MKRVKITDLPPEIQEIVFRNQRLSDKTPNPNLFLDSSDSEGNFSWGDCPEGARFWQEIYYGKYDNFYKRYPEIKPTMKYTLTRTQLLHLRVRFNCLTFREVIDDYLRVHFLKSDNDEIEISSEMIERLFKEGTVEQKAAVEGYGIVFQKHKPKSWEDLTIKHGYFIDSRSNIYTINMKQEKTSQSRKDIDKNVFPTEKLASANRALTQLLYLQHEWRDGWEPKSNIVYYAIKSSISGNLSIEGYTTINAPIGFETLSMAEQFLNEPAVRNLLLIARPLL